MSESERKPVVLFDVDGVLIDPTESYNQTIIDTVAFYFRNRRNVLFYKNIREPIPDSCVVSSKTAFIPAQSDIAKLKTLGSFNNDWDCAVFFILVQQILPVRWSLWKEHSDDKIIGFWRNTIVHVDYQQFYAVIKDIFQGFYLGPTFYQECYGHKPPVFMDKDGNVDKERQLISTAGLKSLAERARLGIVTGRTAFDTYLSLMKFNIDECFESMVTEDDIETAAKLAGQEISKLRKPSIFLLEMIFSKMELTGEDRVYYLGDTVDDETMALKQKKVIFIKVNPGDVVNLDELI